MKVVEHPSKVKELVGQEIGVSDWLEIDQDRINMFAEATGDHQWIHVDVERAKKEFPAGTTIAHGFLTLSLIPALTGGLMKVENVSRGINYGCNKVRFTNMVPVNARVRGRQVLKEANNVKGDGVQLISEVTIEVEGQERPAMIAETIAIIYP